MNKIKLKNFEEKILYLAIFFVVLFANEILLFLFLGINKTLLFWSFPIQLIFFTLLAEGFIFSKTKFSSKYFVLGLSTFVLFNSFFFHPGTLEYHDQGVYSNAAIYFSTHDSFVFHGEQFKTYGGFSERPNSEGYVIHKFPAYIAYLTPFYFFFGFHGFIIANAILLFFTLLSIYLLTNLFIPQKLSLIPIIFLAICFPFFWFSRETFSEILLMFLFWTSLYVFFRAKEQNPLLFLFPLYSSLLMVLTRYEGFIPAFLFTLVIFLHVLIKQKSELKSFFKTFIAGKPFFFIALLVFLELALIFTYIFNYQTETFFSNIVASLRWLTRSVTPQKPGSVTNYPYNFSTVLIMFSFFSLYFYDLGVFMLAIALGVMKELKTIRKFDLNIFLIFILASPGLYFFINPSVSLYHPWAARRYFPVLIPFVVLMGCIYLIKLVNNKKVLALILTAIFVLNIIDVFPTLFFKQGEGVSKMIKGIAARLPQDNTPIIFWDTYNIEYYAAPIYLNYDGEIYINLQLTPLDKRFGIKENINQAQFDEIIRRKGEIFVVSCLKTSDFKDSYLKDYKIDHLGFDEYPTAWIKTEGNVRVFQFYPEQFKSYWDIVNELSGLPPHQIQKRVYHVNYYNITQKK